MKTCGNYRKWDVDCPPKTKLKCPLIIVRYETGPSGRKVRKEKSLGTNDEADLPFLAIVTQPVVWW